MKIADSLRGEVENILRHKPSARSSDNILFYWWLQRYYRPSEGISAKDFLEAMEKGKIPKFEAMTRTRRWVQDKHEELRSPDYEARKEHEKDVQLDLGYGT